VLSSLSKDSVYTDSALFEFKQGMAHFSLKDYDEAVRHFHKCDRPLSLVRPLALECIGDIMVVQGKASDAVNSYLAARQDSTLAPAAVSSIQDKLYSLVMDHPLLAMPYPELAGIVASRHAVEEPGVADSAAQLVDSLIVHSRFALLDSVLAVYLDSMEADKRCGLAVRIAALKAGDSALATPRLFGLARAALQCKKNAAADSLLLHCERRSDFTRTVNALQFLVVKGLVCYGLGKHADAVKYLSAFVKKSGPTPEAVMALGRANRALGNDSEADAWYSRFAALYPKHPNAQDVLWYLAWEQEEKGHYQNAISLYRKTVAMKKNGARSDEAAFRVGLCLYKDQKYNLACSTFETLVRENDESPFAEGSLFWKAKCLSALGRETDAAETFRKAVRSTPTDFYAFRAREMLALSGDTARLPDLDTSFDRSRTRAWLDSISVGAKPLSAQDSIHVARGTICMLCGLASRAPQFLDGLENRYPANLALQFDLASLYKSAELPVLSYKAGHKLAWRVPAEARSVMPRPLVEILYPQPFMDIIRRESGKNGVDPFLVLAVIRQESIFDPAIVSRVGAIGLMQLMPTTSQTVCKELGEQFNADSLYRPPANIRQGAYYIKRLLDQFGGNLVLAIASYNGGPNKATEWYAKNKRTTYDLFIENLGFTETRGYVKKVLANYWTYRRFAAKSNEK